MSKEISLPNNRVIELNWNMCQLIFLILKILHNGQFFLSFLFPFFQLYFSSLFIIILKIFRNGIHGYFLKTALIKKQSENLKVGRWNVFTCKTFSFIYIYIDICTLQRKHFPVYALQSQWQSLKHCNIVLRSSWCQRRPINHDMQKYWVCAEWIGSTGNW